MGLRMTKVLHMDCGEPMALRTQTTVPRRNHLLTLSTSVPDVRVSDVRVSDVTVSDVRVSDVTVSDVTVSDVTVSDGGVCSAVSDPALSAGTVSAVCAARSFVEITVRSAASSGVKISQ